MSKTVIIMMGASGSGKSTLESYISAREDVHKVISVTTRQPREGEVNGVDYYFISEDEFKSLSKSGSLVQETSFGGNYYGSSISEYTQPEEYVTLVAVPKSSATFANKIREAFPDYQIKFIYFDISTQRLVENMSKRGDTSDMIVNRLLIDDIQKQWNAISLDLLNVSCYVVDDDLLNSDLFKLIDQYIEQ